MKLPNQRWSIAPSHPEKVQALVKETGLSPLIAQVILNRGIDTPSLTQVYLNPDTQILPSPLEEFPDLNKSIALLKEAIETGEKIAICGDYDADGMTSTSLLLRALKHLGADVYYEIPSRMKDGYGINKRIVESFAQDGVGLILTVDNGISAYEPIQRAVELGLTVIITDHHDLPEKLPPAQAILNPKLLPIMSPYRGLAGVGVAYILAVTTAQSLDKTQGIIAPLLELFTLGTIADLAPLVGVNRRWLKRGLKQLPNSQLAGVQALMQVAGVSEEQKQLKPDDIGFKLGPRINAVGRIGDPQVAIELLTTDDLGIALERAMQCEQINGKRQSLCEEIEREAIHLIETTPINYEKDRVLLIVKHQWHHGVIGIVASRLVERYGVPVFIGTYEEEDLSKIRGSARGIEEFNVFEALVFCDDLLGKYGGHKAAGGFSFSANNLEAFKERLSSFAHQCLEPNHLKPLVKIDAQADFKELNFRLYQQIDGLQPWGIGNAFPIFWTDNVRVLEQRIVGKNNIKIVFCQDHDGQEMKAIAWRYGRYFPLPARLDIAYKLTENHWNGNTNIELDIVGMRLPLLSDVTSQDIFEYQGKQYICYYCKDQQELRIQNPQGKILSIRKGQRKGLLGINQKEAKEIDVTKPPYYDIIKGAMKVLNLS
ncbi:single-stranded-DNA-specific exonuclease RecJ [Crocosphaera sp. XPORK-15E]|uniref:single-stranded-DNA-specific exonuclease RecJ n=1 Tax=Crocosphaera sp. XPORK-15E TaxID=3110247 RepID=UPI002B213C31|nr:single-stranded-DNA-specific exonuclease RecJ [Crocosphaera sp. XPORK-15E]MEA5535744.1 single-stranded-DNA-specific exonuclease RecJ [Crocosphaera sp. XPORK-15E]